MPPRKRATDASEEPSSSSSQRAPPSKKSRFVEPGEDPATFAEEVDSALENPSANRKGRVKNEGYDSDSSDDGEGVVFSRKKDAENDEDDDMFAVADKEEKTEETKKKKESYMRLGDIEGQEFGNSGSEDEEDEEDEPEDEDDAERRKKAGMGYELSSFNMREEMEEGKFTEDGSYVRSFDPHGIHDRWMEGLDEKEIKQARKRKKQQERVQKERVLAEEKELEESGGKPSLEKGLLTLLKKGETVLESLQRLGAEAKKVKQKSKKNDDTMNVDSASSDIERVTHLASTLMSLGETDIYSKTYEELVRSVRSSGTVDANWTPPSANRKYEYKWDLPGGAPSDQTFGPFEEEEMQTWFKASYFGPSGEKVKVRQVGGEWKDWDDLLL